MFKGNHMVGMILLGTLGSIAAKSFLSRTRHGRKSRQGVLRPVVQVVLKNQLFQILRRVPGRVRGLPEEFLEPSLQLLPEVGNVAVKEELHELVKVPKFFAKTRFL